MRSFVPRLATLVPSIWSAYLPARTGACTILKLPAFGSPPHCFVSPVSKSPRQRTSACASVAKHHSAANHSAEGFGLRQPAAALRGPQPAAGGEDWLGRLHRF